MGVSEHFVDTTPLAWLVDEWLREQKHTATAENLAEFLRTTSFIFGPPTTDRELQDRWRRVLVFPADASGAKRRRAWNAGRALQLASLAAGPTELLADDTLCTFYVRMGTQMRSADGVDVVALRQELAELKKANVRIAISAGMNKAIKKS